MREQLIEFLKEYGYPVRRQGSFGAAEKYPDNFFTVWCTETEDASHYSNQPAAFIFVFDINFYSTSARTAEETIQDVAINLRKAGWIINGLGQDAASDEPSHYGKNLQAIYRKNAKLNNTEPVTVPDTEFEIEIEQDEPERFSHIEEQAAKY